ncbi:MAG: hypothetical protein AB7O55_29175, partial [Lautropia sp.]
MPIATSSAAPVPPAAAGSPASAETDPRSPETRPLDARAAEAPAADQLGPDGKLRLGREGRPLAVADLLDALVEDGQLPRSVAATLTRDASQSTADRHPQVVIADR